MDGKTRLVRDDQTHILVHSNRSHNYLPGVYSDQPYEYVAVQRHMYVRTRHTHPDGSVFFEWEKPRGTKIG